MRDQFDHTGAGILQHEGASLYFEEAGTPSAPTLLLLHGGMGSIEEFNVIASALAPHFRLVGLDSRGHGRSTNDINGLTYERLQHDVEALVAHLELEEFSILGFSDGGIVAYRLGALTDLPIAKIAVVGTPWNIAHEVFVRERRDKITGAVMKERQADYYEAYQRLNPSPDWDGFIADSLEMWLDESDAGHVNGAVKQIRCPVYAAMGAADHMLPLDAVTSLPEVLSDAVVSVIPFARHVAFQDQPEVFLLQLGKFFQIKF